MRILIATPLSPPDPGGPSYYSEALAEALRGLGHEVALESFTRVKHLPTGIRHLVYAFRLFQKQDLADVTIALDAWSVALPVVVVGKVVRKPAILRTGGDFLWERYIERTDTGGGNRVLLSDFYTTPNRLTRRERLIYMLTKRVIFALVTKIVFSTVWQRDLFIKGYGLSTEKTAVIENYFGPKKEDAEPASKKFVCAWRATAFKNTPLLMRAFEKAQAECPDITLETYKNIPREQVFDHLKEAWAVIVPSLSEISPNLVLEALQFNRPVIVTQDMGLRERLGDTVLYVDPQSEEDFVEKICFLADPKHEAMYRERARRFTHLHTYDDMAREFLAVIAPLTHSTP